MSRMRISCLLVGCVALVAPSVLLADVTGSILGTITDPSTAAVQGVQVTVTNIDTNLSKETTTDVTGKYVIIALPAGRYKLEAAFSGFQKSVETGIVLNVNDKRRVDLVLQVGATQQEVSVTANSVQVETTNTQLGQVIDEKKIMEMPLNGRSYLDLLVLQPGVAPAGTRNEGPGTVSVNGQRENSNGFLVNGGDVSGVGNFEAQIQPNLDAVQEFRLITNSFDAEYGRFSGAITNAITKSGSNSIHGSVFEFLRNDKMDARGFFDEDKGALQEKPVRVRRRRPRYQRQAVLVHGLPGHAAGERGDGQRNSRAVECRAPGTDRRGELDQFGERDLLGASALAAARLYGERC